MANLTPHTEAALGDFAKTVLMPGDPLRAEFIANTFLQDAKLVNNVRGIHGYTGTYNGVKFPLWQAAWVCRPSVYILTNCILFTACRTSCVSALRER